MKKFIYVFLSIILVITLTGCSSKSAKNFKKEYEQLNDQKNSRGVKYRKINVSSDNPFEEVKPEEIIKKMDNKESFYVYFGDAMCPWCRSVLEQAIKTAQEKNIKKIYYVDIWDKDGNEVLRDKYEIKDGKASKVSDGAKEYKTLLKYFDNVLADYTLTDDNNKEIKVGEKRIYAPNYIYVKNGKAVRLTEGISSKQTDPYMKLSKDILNDEKELFEKFFK